MIVHMAKRGIDTITDLMTVSLPSYDSMEDIPQSLLSIRSSIPMKLSSFGFVVPIGNPRYVKGRASGLQWIRSARSLHLSEEMFIGTSDDF